MNHQTLLNDLQDAADQSAPYRTAVISQSTLHDAVQIIQDQSRGQRDAWRSFYVACGVVAMLVIVLFVREIRGPETAVPVPTAAPTSYTDVLPLDPTAIYARKAQAVEI